MLGVCVDRMVARMGERVVCWGYGLAWVVVVVVAPTFELVCDQSALTEFISVAEHLS